MTMSCNQSCAQGRCEHLVKAMAASFCAGVVLAYCIVFGLLEMGILP